MASPYAITTTCHINPPSLEGNGSSVTAQEFTFYSMPFRSTRLPSVLGTALISLLKFTVCPFGGESGMICYVYLMISSLYRREGRRSWVATSENGKMEPCMAI